jgi:N-acetyldiaminopimelate deacetylase
MLTPLAIRHHLHGIPELAFEEHKTKAFLKSQIQALLAQDAQRKEAFALYEFEKSPGLLLVFRGASSMEPFTLFRADMDALPLVEDTAVPYASKHEGCMHACGHDVHMAVLMGLIAKVWETLPKCNLLFLFQPAEEGKGGAQSVLAEGLIQKYPVAAAFALHVASDMPVGTISSKAGIFFGIPQEFDVRFYGKSAHVAFPEQGVNALACGLDFLSSIQSDLDELAQSERIILHVGKMQAGRIRNVIADLCVLEGTHRTLNQPTRDRINELIHVHAERAATAIGAGAEVELLGSYDAVVNDAALCAKLRSACAASDYQFIEAETVMTGEDFGFFTSIYPGLLFWLGSGSDQPLHSPQFLPQDECIPVGIDVLYALLRLQCSQ